MRRSLSEVVERLWCKQCCRAKAILLQVQSREIVASCSDTPRNEQFGRSTNRADVCYGAMNCSIVLLNHRETHLDEGNRKGHSLEVTSSEHRANNVPAWPLHRVTLPSSHLGGVIVSSRKAFWDLNSECPIEPLSHS